MRKKFGLFVLGLAVVVGGVVALVAFTAQQVNITARVEKDIEVAAVACQLNAQRQIMPETCVGTSGNYGVVVPQEFYDLYIEVAVSKSFFKQERFSDTFYDVLWECKQVTGTNNDVWDNDEFDSKGKYNVKTGDNIPDCRDNLPHSDSELGRDSDNNSIHQFQELDDNIRTHIAVTAFPAVGFPNPNCLITPGFRGSSQKFKDTKEIDFLGNGVLDQAEGLSKCFYRLKLDAPPCKQGFNEFTDPRLPKKPIWCHVIDTGTVGDPQDLETFADLGDDFKIQVTGHSLANPCEESVDICVDADGITTRFSGVPAALETAIGDTLIQWSTAATGGSEGIDTFDNDPSGGSWTAGDDIHLEDPNGSCTGANRNAVHDLGEDCKVLDIDNGLADNEPVSCDLEGFLWSCPPLLAFHDSNNNGVYDNGEDIFVDVNNDNTFN